MEKSLLVSQCVRQLDPSTTTNQDQPSILGLNPQQVIKFMPSEKVNNKKKERKCNLFFTVIGQVWELCRFSGSVMQEWTFLPPLNSIYTRMLREWNRLFPERWRNIWRKSALVFSLTVSLNVVKYRIVPACVTSLQPPSGHTFGPQFLHCYPF